MTVLLLVLITWGLSSFGLHFIDPNPWMLFLWIPLGLLVTILIVAFVVFVFIFPIFTHTKMDKKYKFIIVREVLKMVNLLCGAKVVVLGKENIVKDKTVFFVSNHKSMLDPLVIYATCEHNCALAAKSTLWKCPPLLPILKAFRVLKINREDDRETSREIVKGIKLLREENVSMILFPEGGIKTREVEQMVDIKPGAYKLATKTNAPIQPIAIFGNSKLTKWVPFRLRKVTIKYLPAIYPSEYEGMTTTEIATLVYHRVNENYPNEVKYNDKI